MIWLQVLARRTEGESSQEIFPVPSAPAPHKKVAHLGHPGAPSFDSPCPGNHDALCPANTARSPGLFHPSTGPPQVPDSGSQALADHLYYNNDRFLGLYSVGLEQGVQTSIFSVSPPQSPLPAPR